MMQSHPKQSSIRRRTLVVLIATVIGLLMVLGIVSRIVLDAGFVRLEQRYAQQELERVREIFQEQCNRLEGKAADWAMWDDMYRYMIEPTDAFKDANMIGDNLRNVQIEVLLLYDLQGILIHAAAFDPHANQTILVDPVIIAALQPSHELLQIQDDLLPQQQILRLENKALLLSAWPVLTSTGTGPARGTLLMGRWLDDKWINKIGHIAKHSLTMNWRDEMKITQRVSDELDASVGISLQQNGSETLQGFFRIDTSAQEYPLILALPLSRDIVQQGEHTFALLLIVISCSGVVLALVVLFTLDRTVLSRLQHLSSRVAEISQTNDPVGVVRDTAPDELGRLGEEVNRLLATQRGWRDQITSRNASMSLIFNALPIGLLTLDANGRVQSERSSASGDLLGRHDLDGADFGEVIAPGTDGVVIRRRLLDFLQLVRVGNLSPEELEDVNPVKTITIKRIDGLSVVRCRFYRIDEMNSTTRRMRKQEASSRVAEQVLVTITDISDEQRLEAEVARSQADYQQLKAMAEDVDLFNTFINACRTTIAGLGSHISMLGDNTNHIRLQDIQRSTRMLMEGGEIFKLSALLKAAKSFDTDLISFIGMTHISDTEIRRCRYGVADLEGAVNQIERQFRTLLGVGLEEDALRPTGLIRQSAHEATPEELRTRKRILLSSIAGNKLEVARIGLAPIIRAVPLMARRREIDVRFIMAGEETAIEQHAADVLNHVMPHLIRFTLDQGFDSLEERIRAHKPEQMSITLSCERLTKYLIITLVDDGHGINPTAMRRIAVEQNLLTEEDAAALDDQSAQELVFKVMHNDGDGSDSGVHYVGLNLIVQRMQDELSAHITVQSTVTQGTAIVIQIPLAS